MVAPDYPYIALRDLAIDGVRAFARGHGIPTDTPDKNGWVLGEDYAEAGSEVAEEVIAGPQRPAKNASTEAWVDYLAALQEAGEPNGLARDEAEGKSRDELIAWADGANAG